MKYAYAAICAVFSFLIGAGITRYLTCHPLKMSFYLLITAVLSFILLLLLYNGYKKKYLFVITLIFCLAFLISGYLTAYHSFAAITEIRKLPDITRLKNAPGKGHTAVVLIAHGEPETYDPSAWLRQMKEFDEQKIPFIPYAVRPLFFNSLREKYLTAGRSGHNFECLQILRQVEDEYRKKGDTITKFYISYLENEPRPDTAVIQALNEGASQIILCNLFVTISNHTQEAIDMIEPIKLADYGVEIKQTKPLYDSKTLQRLYLDRVHNSVKSADKSKIGVILVGHGQPVEWDKEFPTETQQEVSFREDILKQLAFEGYTPKNLKLAWMEFREPKPKEAINQLIQNGATEIYYFSTIIGSESIHVKFDVPKLMQEVKLPRDVRIKQLFAFDNKAGISYALIERIEAVK